MLESFGIVGTQVLILFILIALGFALGKGKMLNDGGVKCINDIVIYVVNPCLIISAFQRPFETALLQGFINALIGGAIAHTVSLVLAILVFRKQEEASRKVLRFASVFSNCGFMCFPLLQSLFSDKPELLSEIMIYGAVIIAIFNLLTWTFGVYIMTGDKKQVSFKQIVLNPVIIALVIGFLLFVVLQKPLVDIAPQNSFIDKVLTKFMQSMNFFAEMVTPCSMIVIGIRLANVNLKQLFMDKLAYTSAFLKLVVMSFVSMLTVAFLPFDNTVKYAVFFLLSMPSAANTAMFSVKFGGDSDFAAVTVLLSTVLSVLTIPLMFLVMSGVFGITV